MNILKDPIIHSHIEDLLPDLHPLAFVTVNCKVCNELLHAANNECMQTWVETGQGNYCIKHFAEIKDVSALDDIYGLNIKSGQQ